MSGAEATRPWTRAHDEACARGEDGYSDPETGNFVFTRLAHEKRGYCCGSACRHCPYEHVTVRK